MTNRLNLRVERTLAFTPVNFARAVVSHNAGHISEGYLVHLIEYIQTNNIPEEDWPEAARTQIGGNPAFLRRYTEGVKQAIESARIANILRDEGRAPENPVKKAEQARRKAEQEVKATK